MNTGPTVLTFGQFAARGGYDCEISHDRLRFPHGISKRQERDNRAAASHHLREAVRAMRDYNAAVASGSVRPPTEAEDAQERIFAHPDHASTRATWRVRVRRVRKQFPGLAEIDAVAQILQTNMGGLDPWAETLGLPLDADQALMAEARLRWMGADGAIG